MIIRQTTTLIFEYPQDYLQEQEWCKTKEDRWIHKGTDTLGAVYENTISYSIGQPNNSEETNNSTISKMEQVEDETKTQMKTQNSNLTFKTLEYCDICDHKGCEECIANALDEHCMPSQFNKQIEDECAKEYEELGLKELKELIEADRKTEPTISKMEQVDEPQTMLNDGTLVINVEDATKVSRVLVGDDKNRGDLYYPDDEDEPQTDCAWR